jgi:hypothetical protein
MMAADGGDGHVGRVDYHSIERPDAGRVGGRERGELLERWTPLAIAVLVVALLAVGVLAQR